MPRQKLTIDKLMPGPAHPYLPLLVSQPLLSPRASREQGNTPKYHKGTQRNISVEQWNSGTRKMTCIKIRHRSHLSTFFNEKFI